MEPRHPSQSVDAAHAHGSARPRRARAAALVLASVVLALQGCGGLQRAARGEATASGSVSGSTPAEPVRAAQGALLALNRERADFAVEIIELDWHDGERNRPVPARLYLPRSTAPVPLVVFSHGLGGSRFGYRHLGQFWAQNGIATLHPQHLGSDRAVWTERGLAALASLRAAASTDNAIARVRDVSYAIDRALKEPTLEGRLDAQRVGVAGHSFGANTALLAAGARFRLDDSVLSFTDRRIRGAIVLSAPSLPDEQDPFFVYSPIAIPTLHLTGTRDATPIPGLSTMPEQRRVPFDSMGANPRYLGVFDGGRHSMFSDWGRGEDAERIRASARTLTLAFWREVFDRDIAASALLEAPQRASPKVGESLATWEAQR